MHVIATWPNADSHMIQYILQVSIVEVYNECVYDLLVPPSEGHEKLQVQKRGKEVVVPVSGYVPAGAHDPLRGRWLMCSWFLTWALF